MHSFGSKNLQKNDPATEKGTKMSPPPKKKNQPKEKQKYATILGVFHDVIWGYSKEKTALICDGVLSTQFLSPSKNKSQQKVSFLEIFFWLPSFQLTVRHRKSPKFGGFSNQLC